MNGTVDFCPKNLTDTVEASTRLGCGRDKYGNDQYMCLPNKEKTSLVEFCHNGIMGIRNKGYCLEKAEGDIQRSNCSVFIAGCPDINFYINEMYKYPACLSISAQNHCYLADPSCGNVTWNTTTKGTTQTTASPNADSALIGAIVGSLAAVVLIVILIIAWVVRKRQRRKQQAGTGLEMGDTNTQNAEREHLFATSHGTKNQQERAGNIYPEEKGHDVTVAGCNDNTECEYDDMACSQGENVKTIEDFLNSLGLQEYTSIMEEEGIDLDSLTELSDDDLKSIGIAKLGHRKKILKNIQRTPLIEVKVSGNIPSQSETRTPVSSENTSVRSDEPDLYGTDNEIRIAVVGKTGCGKSATANSILGKKIFFSEPTPCSVTSNCAQANQVRFNKKILIVDTPGVCDTSRSDADIQREIQQCITITAPGPHAFILVLGIGRYTEEEHSAVRHFIEHFGESIYEYFIVLFTRKDELDRAGKTLQEFVEKAPDHLKEFIDRCQNRVLAFNNTLEGAEQEKQVQDLLKVINKNIERNGGNFYTNKMYKEAERLMEKRQEEIKEQEKEKWEKERRKIEEAVAEKFQAELKAKGKEMQEIQNKISELEDMKSKNDQEVNKLREFQESLKKMTEEQKKMNEDKEKEMAVMKKRLDEKIDDHTREIARREAAENQGIMAAARNLFKWAWDSGVSYFSSK